jgi:partner of Y14 and mago protein
LEFPETDQGTRESSDRSKPDSENTESSSDLDQKRKLRNLRKKLRDIESLQKKIFSGDLNYPQPEQFAKLERKEKVEIEIRKLEALFLKL